MAKLNNVIKISLADYNIILGAYPDSATISTGYEITYDPNSIYLIDTPTVQFYAAGNAAAGTGVLRNAAGSIQSEKIAISSGTTTKATIQYNSTDNSIDFVV